jgi:uncharacterized protein
MSRFGIEFIGGPPMVEFAPIRSQFAFGSLVHCGPVETSAVDIGAVTAQLGRRPLADFEVVVRTADGKPMVIRNAPFLHDGTPMPTLYWLTDPDLLEAVSRLESSGAVRKFADLIAPETIASVHARYRDERTALIEPGTPLPHPSGGVAGTARGLKCLHAHYAYFLAGGDDPVGALVHSVLNEQEACD